MRGNGAIRRPVKRQTVNRADTGGLESCAKARGFLDAADALLVRRGGKKVLDGGNDAFGGSRQKAVFVCSAGGFRAVLFFRRIASAKRKNQGALVGLSVSAKRPFSCVMSIFIVKCN